METRTIEEVRIYFLIGNDMRGKYEAMKTFLVSAEAEKIIRYELQNQEKWDDNDLIPDFYGNAHIYNKHYKKGSSLEWANPIEVETCLRNEWVTMEQFEQIKREGNYIQ